MVISTNVFKLEEENFSGVISFYNARNAHFEISPIIKYYVTLMGYSLNVLNILRMLLTAKWLLLAYVLTRKVLENKILLNKISSLRLH